MDTNHQQAPGLVKANQNKAQRRVNRLRAIQKKLAMSNRVFVAAINALPCRKKYDLPEISVRVWGNWCSKNGGNLPKAAACWGTVEMEQELCQIYAKQLNGTGAH